MATVQDTVKLLNRLSHNLKDIYQVSDAFKRANETNMKVLNSLNAPGAAFFDDATRRSLQAIDSLNNDFINRYPKDLLTNTLNMQWDAIAKIVQSSQTPALIALKKELVMNNIMGGMDTFYAMAFSRSIIDAPDLAFIKQSRLAAEHLPYNTPRGIKRSIEKMHVGTAKKLANTNNISFDTGKKTFFIESSPVNIANTKELNIVCSAVDILSGITESDLIEFLNEIAKYPFLAGRHHVGQQILEAVQKWDSLVGFDREMYYHGRWLDEEECPYTEAQLAKAPYGVTWHGRYNSIGENHYYFSDKAQGVIEEVKKHSLGKGRVQIAKITPARTISMVDLSETHKQSKFLEYCRFSLNAKDNSNVKREYLIPCFFATCCKKQGIDGIRYYGSRDYTNYVAWDDSYFKCVGFELAG